MVATGRRWRRRVALWAGLIVVAAISLGVIRPTDPAAASCAGPRLTLRQAGEHLTPHRSGTGAAEKLIFRVDRAERLVVHGSNLTFDCLDTPGSGCTGPPREDVVRPMRDVSLILQQHDRRWTLTRIGAIGRDLEAESTILLPAAARQGPATLRILDSHRRSGTQVDLDLI